MKTNRLEAFSDGVIAIIITIMVLELNPPHEPTFAELGPMVPKLLSYLLSFIYVGIYWNNHHHVFHAAKRVSGAALWANLHLLFWLSLIPFATAWAGENHLASTPCALYGFILFAASLAYMLLMRSLVEIDGRESVIARAIGRDRKGWISNLSYAAAVPLCYVSPWIGIAIYVGIALMWLVPDRRIERTLIEHDTPDQPHPVAVHAKPI